MFCLKRIQDFDQESCGNLILDLGFCKECIQNVFFPKSKIQDPRVAEKFCAKGPKFKIQDPKKEFLNPRGWD